MPDDPIIPTIGQVIGAGKQRLIEVRPSAAPHVEHGEYSLPIAGMRGQFALERAYIAEEVKAARLPFSEEEALTELALEYEVERGDAPTKALGEVVLTRTVVHAVRGTAITVPDATDETSAIALLTEIVRVVNLHLQEVYVAATGRGAHFAADASGAISTLPGSPNMGQLVGVANDAKLKANRHFANQLVADGSAGASHLDPDPLNSITADDAFASAPSSSFASNSLDSQTSLLLLVNAIKAAYNAHAALEAKGGTVRAGTQWTVAANPTAVPPVAGGIYTVMADCYAGVGVKTVYPTTEATIDGPGQNLPLWSVGGPTLSITSTAPLFDASATLPFGVTALRAAGGSNGQSDPELRSACTAAWTGTAGPTVGALIAGALQSSGVSKVAVLEDKLRGRAIVYVADGSWGWSYAWSAGVERDLRDEWRGTGCKIAMGRVLNRVVRLEAVVALRSSDYLIDPSAITAALRTVAKNYFDDRPDYYVWRVETLKAKLSRADRQRVLRCVSLLVKDQDGVVLTEPAVPTAGDDLTHWYFADNALDVSYTGPS